MNKILLEISQMLGKHPIIEEENSYKIKYLNVLEYFVQKYSKEDAWANAALRLYIKKLLKNEEDYEYNNFNLRKTSREVISTKFKFFKFYTYRYCLVFDCIFMNAFGNKSKGNKIFTELSKIYHKPYLKKLQRIFDFLYDSTVLIDDIDKVQYMKDCWNSNRNFLTNEPIRIIITANMSAGKSTLLNALVGKKVNKTQNDACTAKVHYIVNKPYEDELCYELDYLLELDADYYTLMEDNEDNKDNEIMVGTYFRTINSSTKRLWFIDTPGVNSSQDELHKQIAESVIKSVDADLMIYLLNGENIGTNDDRKHLLFILENYHKKILFIVNKADRFRKKEDSVSETIRKVTQDLKEIGFADPLYVFPISSYAAYLAKMRIFGEELNEDEQDEYERMLRKLKKEEYQFDTYYPDDIQESVYIESNDDSYQLLMHSGILHLEKIIYNMR